MKNNKNSKIFIKNKYFITLPICIYNLRRIRIVPLCPLLHQDK